MKLRDFFVGRAIVFSIIMAALALWLIVDAVVGS